MTRERLTVAALWAGLTGLGEALVWRAPIFPAGYAREADVSDDAFRLLTRLAVPVLAFVLSVLLVSLARFRARGGRVEQGPPERGSWRAYGLWLGITGALAVVLIINPGLVGLSEIRGEPEADMVIRLEGGRWFWRVTYPEEGVTTTEAMVVPVDTRIRFEVDSLDILHSFWVPAFRAKVDAVPGRTTSFNVTTTETGSFPDDPGLRIQCAELCGTGHAVMAMPVRVVETAEFEAWVEEQRAAAAGEVACEPTRPELAIAARDILFDTDCLAAPADTPFSIAFDNQDPGVPHNVAIYTDETAAEPLFVGEIFDGPRAVTYEVPALPAGTYLFRCDVHPVAMAGTFVVAEAG